MERELKCAITLAAEAGRLILEVYGGEFEVEHKPDEGPVTAADRAADAHIREGLMREFQNDAVLTEESLDDLKRLESERLWLVDPLDGTRQFIERIDEFAVMIGLAVCGKPVLGVVHLPVEGTTYAGAVGLGVHHYTPTGRSIPVHLNSEALDENCLRMAVSRVPSTSRTMKVCEEFRAQELIHSGSVGRKAMLLLSGQVDAYVTLSSRTRHWDSCASDALIRIAGGEFLDGAGGKIEYNTRRTRNDLGLVAARRGLIKPLLAAVERVRQGSQQP